MYELRRCLASKEACIERACEADVGGALDEGAAIGEDREGIGRVFKTEQQAIRADLAERCETFAEGDEVQGTVVFVDLDGVTAAEGDVGALLARERAEDSPAADLAVETRLDGRNLRTVACPEIEGEQRPSHEMGLMGEEL